MSEQLEQQQRVQSTEPGKKPWYKRWWGITGIVIGVILVISVIASAGGSSDGQNSSEVAGGDAGSSDQAQVADAAAEQAAPQEEPQASDGLPGIGTPVRDGKFEFVVEGVQPGIAEVGNEFLGSKGQGSFTLVTLRVTNIGDEPQLFDDSNVTGVDSQGREVSPDSEAGIYANDSAEGFLNEINPGNTITAVVVFDLAPGEVLQEITVKDSLFSGGATIALTSG